MSAAIGMEPEVLSSSASSSYYSGEPTSDPRSRGVSGAGRSPERPLGAAPTGVGASAGPGVINVNRVGGARTAAAANKLPGGSPSQRGGVGAAGTAGASGAAAMAAMPRFADPKDENAFAHYTRRPAAAGAVGTVSQPQPLSPTATAAAATNGAVHPAVGAFARSLVDSNLKCALCAKAVTDVVVIGAQASVACRACAKKLPNTNITELPRSLQRVVRGVTDAAAAADSDDPSTRTILHVKRPGQQPASPASAAAAAPKAALHQNGGAAAATRGDVDSEASASPPQSSAAMQAVLAELTEGEAAERQQIIGAEATGRVDVMTRRSVVPPAAKAAAAASNKSNGTTSRQYKLEADRKYENAEYTAALELYTKAIKLQPADHQSNVKFLYGNRSAAHYMAQRYNECIEDCLEVVRLDPASVKMLSRAARSACTMGDLKRAVDIMESTPKERMTGDMEAELTRYRTGLETLRHAERCFGTPEGDDQYRMLVAQFSDTVPFRVRSAESLRRQNQYMRAVEVLEALSYSTRTPAACRIMSECLYLSGFEYFERARKCIVDAAQLDDGCNELLKKIDAVDDGKQKGNTNFNKKNYGPAAEFYTVAIQAASDNDQVLRVLYCNRAAAYKELGRFREGVEDCTKTLQIDKEFYKAYARRARCHEHLGDHFAAVRDFKKATEYDSSDRELARELRAAEQNLAKEAEKEKDFYFQLGISRTATEREVKLKYRELSLRWHPDKCVGMDEVERERAEHKFKIISEAYATLVDQTKRREYDLKQDRERFSRPGGYNFASTYSGTGTGDYYRGRTRAGGNGFW